MSFGAGWTSSTLEDHDNDGCRDASEDDDDDNDGRLDVEDACPRGMTGWTSLRSLDWDLDGCNDNEEDDDDDSDTVLDVDDACPKGESAWLQDNSTDWDRDGCLDLTEDEDDDNDGVHDMDLNGTMLDLCLNQPSEQPLTSLVVPPISATPMVTGSWMPPTSARAHRHPPQPMHRAVKTWTVMGFICKTTGVHPVPRVGPSMRTVAPWSNCPCLGPARREHPRCPAHSDRG